jgi:phospholipase/carboxylesterase
MKPIETTLTHKVLLPEGPAPYPGLLLVHGRGADEDDLLGLSDYLSGNFFIMSVRAPFPFPGGGGFTWYDMGQIGTPEPRTFALSFKNLSQFIDDALAHYPIDRRRMFLLGFSMGTVMSYALALSRPELIRGVAANSGYVPEGTGLQFQWQGLQGLDVLVTHGEQDPVIPVDFARRAKKLFSYSNAHVTYQEFQAGHHLTEKSLAAITVWLNNLSDTTKLPYA